MDKNVPDGTSGRTRIRPRAAGRPDPSRDAPPAGTIDVRYTGIPSWLPTNGSVNVLVERMPSTNAYVSAPTVVSNGRVTVSGGTITVSVNWSNFEDAYAVTRTP